MTIADLIKHLETKDQHAEVEFIIVQTNGKIIAVSIQALADSIRRVLEYFK